MLDQMEILNEQQKTVPEQGRSLMARQQNLVQRREPTWVDIIEEALEIMVELFQSTIDIAPMDSKRYSAKNDSDLNLKSPYTNSEVLTNLFQP